MKRNLLFIVSSALWIGTIAQETWTQQNNTGANLWAVGFADEFNGIAGGNYGEFYRTNDGGNTWSIDSTVYYGTLRDVQFFNASEGWMATGNLFHTVDGGVTWNSASPYLASTSVYDVHMVSDQIGFVHGLGKIQRTLDGGQSWTLTYDFGMNFGINDIHFKDASNGCVVTHDGMLYRTYDGGLSWTLLFSEINVNFRTVRMVGNVIWIGGGTDTCPSYVHLWKSDDDGQSFADQGLDPTLGAINAMEVLLNGTHVYLAMGSLCSSSKGTVLRSIDSGNSWIEDILPNTQPLASMCVLGLNNLWVSGHDGQINALKTTVGIEDHTSILDQVYFDAGSNSIVIPNDRVQLISVVSASGAQIQFSRTAVRSRHQLNSIAPGIYIAQFSSGDRTEAMRFLMD